MTNAERFWAKVEKTDDCWVWIGARHPAGYGNFGVGRKTVRAHRFSYQLIVGEFDRRLAVLHRCDNPSCVRPDHLFLGTAADNARDCKEKGRTRNNNSGKTHCKRGHEFTPDNTGCAIGGRRYCRQCKRNDFVRRKEKWGKFWATR